MTLEARSTGTETRSTEPPKQESGCCGGPAEAGSGACCALDQEVKASGGAGCGCGVKTATPAKKGCC